MKNRAMTKLLTLTWMIIIRSVVKACCQSIVGELHLTDLK